MEQPKDQENYLKEPVAHQCVHGFDSKQSQNVDSEENEQRTPSNAMQDVGQVRGLSLISEGLCKADISF